MTALKKEQFSYDEVPTWLECEEYTDSDMSVDAEKAWKRAIELMHEKDLSDKAVLDYGCSQGGFLRMLYESRPFKFGLGVDVAVESLAAGRQLLNGQPIEYKHVNALADYSETFDIAQSHWVIFHFEDLAKHAQEMAHVMKPGGVYYFHSGEHSESKVWKRWQPLLEKRIKLPTYTHTPEGCVKAFEDNGFKVTVEPWTWEEMAFAKDFQPDAWYESREEFEDHYLNRLLMFRAVKQ